MLRCHWLGLGSGGLSCLSWLEEGPWLEEGLGLGPVPVLVLVLLPP